MIATINAFIACVGAVASLVMLWLVIHAAIHADD